MVKNCLSLVSARACAIASLCIVLNVNNILDVQQTVNVGHKYLHTYNYYQQLKLLIALFSSNRYAFKFILLHFICSFSGTVSTKLLQTAATKYGERKRCRENVSESTLSKIGTRWGWGSRTKSVSFLWTIITTSDIDIDHTECFRPTKASVPRDRCPAVLVLPESRIRPALYTVIALASCGKKTRFRDIIPKNGNPNSAILTSFAI